jgi:hypothetical protein
MPSPGAKAHGLHAVQEQSVALLSPAVVVQTLAASNTQLLILLLHEQGEAGT